MSNLSKAGRIFYGIAIVELGLQAINYREFPYILALPEHFSKTGSVALALVWGIVFTLAGLCIVFERKTREVAFLFGTILMAIFCFYYIPYEFIASSNYTSFGDWENAAKELALAGGAFVIGAHARGKSSNFLTGFTAKLIPIGAVFYPATIISFGIDHFLYAKEAADYVPAWIPWHLFWLYFCGVALLASGIAVVLKIQTRLAATLLGTMIFIWFVILHIPRVLAAAPADIPGEVTSAIFALAYGGTAFVIAGTSKRAA